MNQKLIVWTLVLLCLASSVSALGILPAKQTITAEVLPANYAGSFEVVNNQNLFMDVRITAEGPLAEYITFDQDMLRFTPQDASHKISFTLELDEQVPPGLLETKLLVEEVGAAEQFDGISSRFRLFHRLIVATPLSGKHVGAQVEVTESNAGFDVETIVSNLGRETILEVKTTHRVVEKENRLFTLRSLSESLGIADSTSFVSTINKNTLKEGEYGLLTEVEYDKELLEVHTPLIIGEPTLEILSVDEVLIANQINKISIPIKVDWNNDIANATAQFTLLQGGKIIAESASEPTTIINGRISTFEAFLDTLTLGEGDYILDITLHYLGFTYSKTIPISAAPAGSRSGGDSGISAYLWAAIIMVTILSLFALLRSSRERY